MTARPDSIVIRPARPDEYDTVTQVWMESWESTGLSGPADATFEELRARIPREVAAGWRLFVAESAGDILAMMAIRPQDHHLDQLFVAPAAQGLGLGRRLLALARSHMPDEIWLRTSTGNERAWRWYEREGFIREKVEQQPGWPTPRAYYRWKRRA